MGTYYPKSKVEISGFTAKHYDRLMNIITLGMYSSLMQKAVRLMKIKPTDKILDLGTGTGRNACLMMRYLSKQGELVGFDISREMISQFKKNCADFPNIKIINERIDQDLAYFILDYNEFSLKEIPFYSRIAFKLIECPYAFDFIEKDWKKILAKHNFGGFEEFFFFKNYVRLLDAKKLAVNKENRVKIAIPTNDGINIFPRMLGRAKELFIYEIENGIESKFIEKRNNLYTDTIQHLKTLDVYELIRDCTIIIAGDIGKMGIKRLQKKGMRLFFRKGNIQESLTDVIKEFLK
jgi:demethylmenaquinone methyltransferase/2-methoxy-6-polyprenyl-1,4-benzoquinol methylase